MSRARRLAAAGFLACAVLVAYLSLELSYYGADFGPGPGFFSFWLAILLASLSLVELVNVSRDSEPPSGRQGFLPPRDGALRILCVVCALIGVILLIQPLGYTITMALFSFALLKMTGMRWRWAALSALLASIGTFYVFDLLQVLLPKGPFGF